MPVNTVYEEKNIPSWLKTHLENLSKEAAALTPSGVVTTPSPPLPANATPAQIAQYNQARARERKEAEERLEQLYPRYPIGERLAGQAPESLIANQRIRDRFNNPEYAQKLQDAENILMRGINPNFQQEVQTYMNPYMQSVLNRIREEGMRTFNENILPSLEAKFVSLGRHGGSRHRAMAERAARNLQNEILSRQENALSQGFWNAANLQNAQTNRLFQGASQLAQFAPLRNAMSLSDISALKDLGREAEARQQEERNIAYQDFIRQRELPLEMLRQRANLTQGIGAHAPGSSMYSNYTPAPPQMNAPGNLGQAAAALYAASAPRHAPAPSINLGNALQTIGTFGGVLNPLLRGIGVSARRDEFGYPMGDMR